MGQKQSSELDEMIMNIYKELESIDDKEVFDTEKVLIYTRQLSKFKGKSMKCLYLEEKYLNPKILNGFLKLFYSSVRLNDKIDNESKDKFDRTYPNVELRKKACYLYFLESIEYVFEGISDFNDISIRNLCFKNSSTFIGGKVKGRCFDFYTKYGLKNYD